MFRIILSFFEKIPSITKPQNDLKHLEILKNTSELWNMKKKHFDLFQKGVTCHLKYFKKDPIYYLKVFGNSNIFILELFLTLRTDFAAKQHKCNFFFLLLFLRVGGVCVHGDGGGGGIFSPITPPGKITPVTFRNLTFSPGGAEKLPGSILFSCCRGYGDRQRLRRSLAPLGLILLRPTSWAE